MTFKEYLKTEEGRRRAINLYRKLKERKGLVKKKHKLPQTKDSRHTDSSTLGSSASLPADSPEQPSMS